MSTSGNTSWELTRDSIINSSLRKLGVLAEGEVANTAQLSTGTEALNALLYLFQTKGMPLWKRVTQPVTLIQGQQFYTITDAVKVPQVVLQYIVGTTQYELVEKSLYDFNQLPKGVPSPGLPVHYYFQPGISDGTLGVWPAPDAITTTTVTLQVVKQKKFDGFVSATDTPDFPSYYTKALIYTLAIDLAPEYGIPLQDRADLKAQAKEYTEEAFNYGDEDGSIYLRPDRRY